MGAAADQAAPVPPTYGTRAGAVAYVEAVRARAEARPVVGRPLVYLIHAPGTGGALVAVKAFLRRTLPGARLVDYGDVFGEVRPHPGTRRRVAQLAAEVAGAVVIPRAWREADGSVRHLLGPAARIEADQLAALGVPVLVVSPAGLVAWPDVRVSGAPQPGPRRLPWLVELPAPGVRVLPTVAASYAALGIVRPVPDRARAS